MRPYLSSGKTLTFTLHGRARRALLVLPVAMWMHSPMPGLAEPAPEHPVDPRAKVTETVIEASRRGEGIEIGIEFEAEDIHQEEALRRNARGIDHLDEELKQEARTNYARLKSGLLTDLRNDGHQLEVLVDTENVPVIFARITRYQTLRWLIEDPRVRAIHENRKIDPPGIFNGGPILRED